MEQHTVIVVGAGPAGLATASRLHRAGLRPVVLERADAVGASWRGRYDRLRLNSPRWYSTLPGGRWRPGTAVFPSRDDVVEHLETYAADEDLDIRLGIGVDSIDRDGDAWIVATSAGDLRATDVVVATGHSNVPHVPAWPGRDRFAGLLLHAADYRSPGAYRGRDVLVVGSGCTGAEIAYDLVEGGAARVRLAVRTPPNIMLRAPIGAPLAAALSRLPTRISDAVARFVRRRTVGDLTAYGLPVPAEGVFSRLHRLHVAPMIVDAEVLDAIRAGRIEIVAGVDALDDTGVLLAGGERIAPDTVIAATGYRTRARAARRPPRRARRPRLPAGDRRRGRARVALRGLRPAAGAPARLRARGRARRTWDRPHATCRASGSSGRSGMDGRLRVIDTPPQRAQAGRHVQHIPHPARPDRREPGHRRALHLHPHRRQHRRRAPGLRLRAARRRLGADPPRPPGPDRALRGHGGHDALPRRAAHDRRRAGRRRRGGARRHALLRATTARRRRACGSRCAPRWRWRRCSPTSSRWPRPAA